jgi:signal transduction histidine kinase
VRSLSLVQRLVFGSTMAIGLGMLVLGHQASETVKEGILRGTSETAVASINALIAVEFGAFLDGRTTIDPTAKIRLQEVFRVANQAVDTRLLQIRLHDLEGAIIYDSGDGLIDVDNIQPHIRKAGDGRMVAHLRDVAVGGVGPIAEHTLRILKVYAPVRAALEMRPVAVAELYFGAVALQRTQADAERNVWILVASIGSVVVVLLYFLVQGASRTIERQRRRLTRNLRHLRILAADKEMLRRSSDRLRLTANATNEALLSQVGADIHDGPIQLLTLLILRLSRGSDHDADDREAEAVKLAADALKELRDISAGLVLPEITDLTLENTIRLAAVRHEIRTGTSVAQHVDPVEGNISLAVRACAYRIVQEGLTNAYRHGRGDGQQVLVRRVGNEIEIEVSNSSFETTARAVADSDERLGLRGMRFRVEALGGTLSTEIGPRTRVSARLPIGEAATT